SAVPALLCLQYGQGASECRLSGELRGFLHVHGSCQHLRAYRKERLLQIERQKVHSGQTVLLYAALLDRSSIGIQPLEWSPLLPFQEILVPLEWHLSLGTRHHRAPFLAYRLRPLARNIGIFTWPCSAVEEQHDSNASTLISPKPARANMLLTWGTSKPSHLSACSFRRNS